MRDEREETRVGKGAKNIIKILQEQERTKGGDRSENAAERELREKRRPTPAEW